MTNKSTKPAKTNKLLLATAVIWSVALLVCLFAKLASVNTLFIIGFNIASLLTPIFIILFIIELIKNQKNIVKQSPSNSSQKLYSLAIPAMILACFALALYALNLPDNATVNQYRIAIIGAVTALAFGYIFGFVLLYKQRFVNFIFLTSIARKSLDERQIATRRKAIEYAYASIVLFILLTGGQLANDPILVGLEQWSLLLVALTLPSIVGSFVDTKRPLSEE